MDDVKKLLEKKQKKKKTSTKLDQIDASLQDFYTNLPSPKLTDSLPYRILMWLIALMACLPGAIKSALVSKRKPNTAAGEDGEETTAEAEQNGETEYQKRRAQKQLEASRLHKELNPTKVEKSDSLSPVITYNLAKSHASSNDDENAAKQRAAAAAEANASKEWTDKQKNDLIKVVSP